MKVLTLAIVTFFFSLSSQASPRTVSIDGLSFDLAIVARAIANYKSCIYALDDRGEEDMAIYYSEALIKRMYLFKKLKPEDRDFATQNARFHAMELDKVPFHKMKVMCKHIYKITMDLE
jgi:hypothetical protein